MDERETEAAFNVMDMSKNATYSLPVSVWAWLKEEARRRNTSASAVIVELVAQEQKAEAA